MATKKDIRRMKNALEAFLRDEERKMDSVDRKFNAWFPIHVFTFIKQEGFEASADELIRNMSAEFTIEELETFAKGFADFGAQLQVTVDKMKAEKDSGKK